MSMRTAWDRESTFFGDRPAPRELRLTADTAAARSGRGPRRRTRLLAAGLLAATAAAITIVVPGATASADPSASTWARLRMCESGGNYAINTGNAHYGAYQFDLATWRSVGGRGYPYQASKGEQDARALILYRERGWQPWQCASILGLREDSDARSGRISDIKIPGGSSGSSSSSGIPAFPGGSHQYFYGEYSANIKTFQNQMHKRGFLPAGTGYYGTLTLRLVKRLQALNGLPARGYIGPLTWRLAWTGKYSASSSSTTSSSSSSSSSSIPAFPGGSHQYFYGEYSANIKTFQNQMHKRGFLPAGTGYYGTLTLRLVKRLQALNGLPARGYIGPQTWRLAWTGKYTNP